MPALTDERCGASRAWVRWDGLSKLIQCLACNRRLYPRGSGRIGNKLQAQLPFHRTPKADV